MCFNGLCIVFDSVNIVGTPSNVPGDKIKGHIVQGQRSHRSFSVHIDDADLFYANIQLSNRYKVQATGTIP